MASGVDVAEQAAGLNDQQILNVRHLAGRGDAPSVALLLARGGYLRLRTMGLDRDGAVAALGNILNRVKLIVTTEYDNARS